MCLCTVDLFRMPGSQSDKLTSLKTELKTPMCSFCHNAKNTIYKKRN